MNHRSLLSFASAVCALATSTVIGFADVVINEIHYDPAIKTELVEFIELHNSGGSAVDVSGWQFTEGVDYTFPAGSQIAAGGYLVVGENPARLRGKYGVTAVGPWIGSLANDGETITLRDAAGGLVDRVDYKLGFPWPTVGDLPGYSIELVNPAFDNDLGGNWRVSVRGNPVSQSQVLIPERSSWKFTKGTAEPSSPRAAWRALNFDDAGWLSGAAPVGYDSSLPMGTALSDMAGNYRSIYLRKKFQVDDPAAIGALSIEALYDDGMQVWINGQRVINVGLPDRDVAYNEDATGAARESANYDEFAVNSPGAFLRAGENVIAVQLHNILLSGSSDAYVDLKVSAQLGSANAGPTPGAKNSVFDTNIPPQARQVEHSPKQPKAGEPVKITAKVTDADGMASVRLLYQIVDPGNYIELNDAAYETSWTPVTMSDGGANGDDVAGDGTYTGIMPESLQTHRRLIRYRIEATDSGNRTIRAPYLDDPSPNFAYFVYNGVPGWSASVQPGVSPVQTFSAEEMGRLSTYHLIAKRASVEDAAWNSKYAGDLYRWWGTLVYDGEVYDHVRYRMRGGVWRYAMGKNMWKFDLNRGHDFQARDNYGNKYKTKWRKVNLGANIQQGDYEHRGEQGMFESVGFRLFNMAGVESPKASWVNYRVIDEAAEATTGNQYRGDYWGLYLALEQEDGRFLDEHDLPDGNLYKMEGGTGELNNQGRYEATDKSDLNQFLNTYRNTTPTEQWWRQNADLQKIYSYHSIVEAIHHYDICFGKNYFYFHNPDTGQWAIHSWDLDLTWADNMFGASCDDIRDHIITRAPFDLEYRNRVREIRDLLYNTDQAWKLIEEYAGIVKGTNAGPNILAADRSMWDYNPVMSNGSLVNTSKAGQGRFYKFAVESRVNPSRQGSFDAAVLIMKDYVVKRAALLDTMAQEPQIPATPTITYTGPANFPVNRIEARASNFSGSGGFAAMKWRVGEVRAAAPGVPGKYEIESAWESAEIPTFNDRFTFPTDVLEVGHAYRARVKMKDATGRWSHWSSPIEFTAAEPDNSGALQQYLKVTEIMYNPPKGSEFEFIELYNASTNVILQLDGVTFVQGIDYTFPAGSALAPLEHLLVVRGEPADNFAAFRQEYNLPADAKLYGPFSGSLNNDGEQLALKTAPAGAEIFSFSYDDSAGWPIAGDGTGHSIVHHNVALEYGRNWHPSLLIGGSPLDGSDAIREGLLINEIAANTTFSDPSRPEYDSNDWIEIYNPAELNQEINLGEFYLSDDAGDLAKWRLPSVQLAPGARITFDEVTHFHNPISTGFGLDQAGEELFLTRFDATTPVQVVDAVHFEGQERGITFGRFPDGGEFFYRLTPSSNSANVLAPTSLLISEIMYHPLEGTNGVENGWQEFVEIQNTTAAPIELKTPQGGYRLRGGISFDFPSTATIPANGVAVMVGFDPAIGTEAAQFRTFYAINADVLLFGPYAGGLGNSSDRISLEKPDAPKLAGDPVAWVVIDEAIYTDASGADGTGESLHRVALNRTANDPQNLSAGLATPGKVETGGSSDRDQDGLPDEWEQSYGLNPSDGADAGMDLDNDGLTNLAEFQAGTNPANATSRLELAVVPSGTGATLNVQAMPGKTYSILYTDNLANGGWLKLQDISGVGTVSVTDSAPALNHRYYRVVTPAQP